MDNEQLKRYIWVGIAGVASIIIWAAAFNTANNVLLPTSKSTWAYLNTNLHVMYPWLLAVSETGVVFVGILFLTNTPEENMKVYKELMELRWGRI